MHARRLYNTLIVLLCSIGISACAAGHGGALPSRAGHARSASPAAVKPAPMARTQVLPASAMHGVKPDADFAGAGWTQIPGSGIQAAAAPDGSLWVLSTEPSGNDKYIWHYANGTWTNIPGLASQLAPAPDGSLYVINSGGGTYHYAGGSWAALGGGAQAISVASDGSTYVVSNGGSGAIWKNSGGSWSYIGGSGSLLAANPDGSSYNVNGGTVGPNGLFVVNASGGIYYTTGSSPYMQFPGAASALAPSIGGLYVLGYPAQQTGEPIFYYDYSTGAWKTEPGSGISVSANAQAIYVVSSNDAIYTTALKSTMSASPSSLALSTSPATGGIVQSFTVSGGVAPYSVSVADSSVATAAFESDGKTVDVTPLDAGSSTVTVTDGAKTTLQVPITSVKFVAHGVDAYNLTINDFAAGPDGNIWYTTAASDGVGIGKFAPGSGTSSMNVLPLGPYVEPQDITAGPDGNMWFTDSMRGGITKMAMDGTYTDYPATELTEGVTVGKDGNVWFTGSDSSPNGPVGIVGTITASGSVTKYPEGIVQVPSIAGGADGNLWATVHAIGTGTSNAVLRVTTSGSSTAFTSSGGDPANISASSDGTLWFTEPNANKIGQITSAGAITAFAVPTANAKPDDITVAQDGTIWFTETNANKIVKISGGTMTEYANPYGDYPQRIKIGPDGHLWFSGNGTLTQLTY